MKDALTVLLRVAGAGLLLLAGLHLPIRRYLKWREDAARLSPVNAAIFHVHSLFVCLVLVLTGLPCLLEPAVFLEPSRAGVWMAWSFAAFWSARLYFQWFVFPRHLWRGKRMETIVHAWLTLVWCSLAALFIACGMWQQDWLR